MPAPLFAPVAALLVLALAAAVLALQRSRQRRLIGALLPHGADPANRGASPDILYFTGENCTVCHVAQRPALRRLRGLIDDVAIREIDVALDPGVARSYRVMTLPTTVVLDRSGRATAVNAGFATDSVLRDQVLAARAASAQPALV
ncbi:MAG TPA: thioredoxin family protein [Candidatus Dormibacteraeota bacterium]|nr:thioredoxin family protein [Candidatus Dormibacteraeota bacterium]